MMYRQKKHPIKTQLIINGWTVVSEVVGLMADYQLWEKQGSDGLEHQLQREKFQIGMRCSKCCWGFCCNSNTRSPHMRLTPVWRGRGETGHLAGAVWAPLRLPITAYCSCLLPPLNCPDSRDQPLHRGVNNINQGTVPWQNRCSDHSEIFIHL